MLSREAAQTRTGGVGVGPHRAWLGRVALLAGLRGPVDRRKYALGAAAACVTMTLPAQLALGYVLGPSRRGVVALHGAVAWAQLCRQGPLWAAIAVAVKDEVGARRRRL